MELRRIRENDPDWFESEVMNVIKLITVTKRPLTVKEVSIFLGIYIKDVIVISRWISALFPLCGDEDADDENKIFSVFHKSVIDWITDIHRKSTIADTILENFYIDPKDAHNIFAERLLLQFDKNNNSDIEWKFPEEKNSYLINHLLDHLDAAGRSLESKQLLMSLPWVIKTIEERGVSVLIGEFKSRLINNNNNSATQNGEFDAAFKMVMAALPLFITAINKQR